MPLGPSVGTVAYNGYTFPNAISSSVRATPIYDSSGRIVKSVQYTIEIETIVLPDHAPTSTAGAQVDDNLEDIRLRLSQAKKELTFNDQGLGNAITVNKADGTGTYVDVDFGPKPQILEWEPVGSNRAARIVWSVTTTIPECSSGYSANRPLEYNYSVVWSIGADGLTRRTISGHIEVMVYTGYLTGSNSFRVNQVADQYRDWIVFSTVAGFKREQEYSLSEDRKQLKFHITDTQIASPNPYPPGVVELEAAHEIGSHLVTTQAFKGANFVSWDVTLSMSIKLAPDMPQHYGWFIFLLIAKSRLDRIASGSVVNKDRNGQQVSQTPHWILTSMKIREELYKREIKCSLTYWLVSTGSAVFSASGLFQVTPGDWENWRVSMLDIHSSRGIAGMRFLPADDILINICNTQFGSSNMTYSQVPVRSGSQGIFGPGCPLPQHSWLYFNNSFQVVQKANTVVSSKLSGYETYRYQSQNSESPGQYIQGEEDKFEERSGPSQDSASETFVESRGSPTYIVRMKGFAVRIGYPIKTPTLVSIGGIKATRIGSPREHTGTVHAGECPIYAKSWIVEYALDNLPGGDLAKSAVTNGVPEHIKK